jgi:transcriptional regulator with AAA-type ATPase domain
MVFFPSHIMEFDILHDTEYTISSTVPGGAAGKPLLALTILWHPLAARVGEQHLEAGDVLELGRYQPLFRRLDASGGDAAPLGERCVARLPLTIRRHADGGAEIAAPESRMAFSCDGTPVTLRRHVTPAQLAQGVILSLGRAVLVCLHQLPALPKANAIGGLIGVGAAALALRDQLRQAAATDLHVLLLGPSGSGKEVAAQAIHAASRRAQRPLVAVNMGGMSEALAAADLFGAVKGAYTGAVAARDGYFAEAGNGTLFLDEIGDTPAAVQPMLLRAVETGLYRPLGASANRRCEARLIAATDRDLETPAFNQPLLRRLEAFAIRVPALRERREDIGLLIVHFMRRWMSQTGVAVTLPVPLAGELCHYNWPGNVRQLAHVVGRICLALADGEEPRLETLVRLAPAPEAPEAPAPRARLADIDDASVVQAMEQSGWRIRGAAMALGISRPSLYKLLASHPQIRGLEGIPRPELNAAWADCDGNAVRCASLLKTPSEPLRRHFGVAAAGREHDD